MIPPWCPSTKMTNPKSSESSGGVALALAWLLNTVLYHLWFFGQWLWASKPWLLYLLGAWGGTFFEVRKSVPINAPELIGWPMRYRTLNTANLAIFQGFLDCIGLLKMQEWREWRDSNPRPLPWQGSILTNWTTTPFDRCPSYRKTMHRFFSLMGEGTFLSPR